MARSYAAAVKRAVFARENTRLAQLLVVLIACGAVSGLSRAFRTDACYYTDYQCMAQANQQRCIVSAALGAASVAAVSRINAAIGRWGTR